MLNRYSVLPPLLLPSGHVVVSLGGEIDVAAAAKATATLTDAIRTASAGVVVDMREVTFIDASGLGVLVRAYRHSGQLPAGLRLAAVPRHAVWLLSVTGLDQFLPVFPTVGAAVGGGFSQQTCGDFSASAANPRERLLPLRNQVRAKLVTLRRCGHARAGGRGRL